MINTSTNAGVNIKYSGKEEFTAQRKEEVKALQEEHQASKEANISQLLSSLQAVIEKRAEGSKSFEVQYEEFQSFLQDIAYECKAIANLSQDEATELVSEDGFFGVTQTSERIANFVILGSGGDENLLRAGREGVLQGLKDAEALWGGKLPDISYATIDKAVELIDQALIDGGFSVLDVEA